MSLLREAVSYYDDLLKQRADQVEALMETIYREQENRGVVYSTRPIPTMLRPQFLTEENARLLDETVAIFSRILERVIKLYSEDEYVRERIPFPDDAVPYFMRPTGLKRNLMIARFDSFLQGDRLKYIEFNTDSPASAVWNEVHQEVFDSLPLMQEFRKKFRLRTLTPRRMLLDALLEAHRDFGLTDKPRLAIVDWRNVATWPEFELAKAYFEAHGLETCLADPRELEIRHGQLYAGDFKVNLVYRRVIWRELLNRKEECKALFEAFEQGLASIANPFRSKVAGNKAILAFLSNPDHRHLFAPEELEVIDRHLPWTAVLRHRPVNYEGGKVDPFELAYGNKDQFVLKPLNAYGGKGVMLGDEVSQTEWEAALAGAEGGGWCMQERVTIPQADFPVVDGGLHFESRKINLNPFTIGGQYGGCFTRVSVSSIINVTAGGGMVPTYTVLGD